MSSARESVDLFDIRLPAYLLSISDGPDNRLVIVVEEATGLGPPPDPIETGTAADDVLNEILVGARTIVPGPGDRVVQISWLSPVCYAVTDESFALPERDGSTANGRVARVIENSWFDDFVKAATWANDDFPGPMRHYSIVTNNHCLNVISAGAPQVRLVSACDLSPDESVQ